MESNNILLALPIDKHGLNTGQIIHVKCMPRTLWKKTRRFAHGLPRLLTIITTREPDSKKERELVVVGHHQFASKKESNISSPIYRYTDEKVTGSLKQNVISYMKKHQLPLRPFVSSPHRKSASVSRNRGIKRSNHKHRKHHSKAEEAAYQLNQKIFDGLQFTMVVSGYHLGYKKLNNGKSRPYINTFKEYNFQVDRKTLNIMQAKKHRVAIVITAKGVRKLVINHIIKARGKIARQQAKKLKPVKMFLNHGIRNKWIRGIYRNKLSNLKH